ncbi:hypothetical protein Bca52824_022462 [Brassica carinata]|uniref:non-specific serine/threonine protein kinase n=1 Tax=Brassica carinata TaxID=52824 RepID=A0A8X7VH53_BRACI|nr:hypothetical protein Bca52824_022462 [Brassica carinata]
MGFWIILCFHVTPLVLAQEGDQFLHYNFSKADLHLDGVASTRNGPLHLTNYPARRTGHAFHKFPMNFTASSSFSTEFVFAIIQSQAFVVSPTIDLRYGGTETSGLGLFNKTNDNKTENHIRAVELDTNLSLEALDKSDNHVGIDINSIVSVEYANASYFNDTEGKNKSLLLTSANSILIWIPQIIATLFFYAAVEFCVFAKEKSTQKYANNGNKEYSPRRYSFKNLYKATKGFKKSRLLGAGGFGKVYKGELPTGVQIAVKRVSHDAEQGMQQYVAEIASMGRLRHKNLVQLLGYCRRKGEFLLVYECMPNGSLDDYLFNENKLKDITWSQRLNIVKGVASALLYLHEDWEQVVLHRDIKASNVLLDADLNGRLGDFGLARFHDRGKNLEATSVVGTIGYMAPELTTMGVTTTWTDVYAFGAFILEVVCGRRPIDPQRPPELMILLKWVATCGSRDNLMVTVDTELLLKLGILCSQSGPESRPSMRQIVHYLEGIASIPDISFDIAGFGMPNMSNETVTQMMAPSSSANLSFEDVSVLFGGR